MQNKLLIACVTVLFLVPANLAMAQRIPSRGTDFEQLLAMAHAAAAAKQTERGARLAFLARSRILVRATRTAEEAMLRAFDDIQTGAVKRAQRYVEVLGNDTAALALPAFDAAVDAIAAPLKAQADALIAANYKQCASFVIEPLWTFDPAWALEAVERMSAIPPADIPKDDEATANAMRLGESMSWGVPGIYADLGTPSARQKEIQDLRRKSAGDLVGVAKAAIAAKLYWSAWDLEFIGPTILPLSAERFWETTDEARPALGPLRGALSKSTIAAFFKNAKKGLANKGWKVGADAIDFPPTKTKKPGLFVTATAIDGDYRFAGTFATQLGIAPVGIVFAYKSDDDFCAAVFSAVDGKAHIDVDHYVKGTPTEIHRWTAASPIETNDPLASWPIAFERHGDSVWMTISDFGWAVAKANVDLDGAFGFYLPATAEPTRPMQVAALDFERLPDVEER